MNKRNINIEEKCDFRMPENLKGVHIHFVGIKGTGMAALVEIMHHCGAVISGSDVSERFYTDEILENLGIKAKNFDENNINDDIDFVIYSSAYKTDKNPDLIAAISKNIPCILYTQALGQYSSLFYSCGVCGVHGKTSTTGLVGTILKELDLPVQVLVGSRIKSFGDSCTFTSDLFTDFHNQKSSEKKSVFVAETCEYQRHFMQFEPKNIILTSVESDHEDYYPTFKDIQNAFVDYLCKLPPGGNVIYCADDKGAAETVEIVKKERNRSDLNFIPYGVSCDNSCDFKIILGEIKDGASHFKLNFFEKKMNDMNCSDAGDGITACQGNLPGVDGKKSLDFRICVPGHHEILDAVAAIALSCTILKYFGKDPLDYYKQIADGVSKFSGGKRRSEIIKKTNINGNDVIVIDDYGHHPTAVNTTLQGYKEFYGDRKIIVDFMSHTYSRTQSLLDEFSKCFSYADEVILHKIYSSARENPEDFEITGKTLFEKVKENYKNPENVFYFQEVLDAKDFVLSELAKPLEKGKNGYLFVTMGAGDNWKLGQEI